MDILKDGSIYIQAPQQGIGSSYLDSKKAKNIQCLDINSVPGVCFANYEAVNQMNDYIGSYTAGVFTADAGTDLLTCPITKSYAVGMAITVSTTGTLPAPLAASTTYYVSYVSGNTIKLATTLYNAIAGTHINITDTGSGTHSIAATGVGPIMKIIQNPAATTANYKFFAIDSSGKVFVQYSNIWVHLPGNSANSGQGIEIWKGYLFLFTTSAVEVYGPLSAVGNTASWSTSWQTLDSDAQFHPSCVASNDRLYVGAGRYVAELYENTGSTFAPGTGATFTYTQAVLTLPANYRIKSMAELAGDLAIGTWKGSDLDTYATDHKVADIFFWDKSSTLSFRRPVSLQENGINQLITVGNTLYIVAGHEGRIYATNGVDSQLVARIPDSLTNTQQSSTSLWFWPNAIMRHKGKIYIGVSSSATGTIAPLGVYSFDTDTGNIAVENILSTGNTGSSGRVIIGALISAGSDTYYIGVIGDASVTYQGGINIVKPANGRYISNAYFETNLILLGSEHDKKTYTNCDILLGKALNTDQAVKLYYRSSESGSYASLGTYDYATYGAFVTKNVPCVLGPLSTVQFKVELVAQETQDSPEFVSLALHP